MILLRIKKIKLSIIIVSGFLNKNPADRLGCNRESGFVEIMTHAFFKVCNKRK